MPDNPPQLSAAQYKALRRDVQALAEQASTSENAGKLDLYWRIGRRIDRERIDERAGYHNAILRDLAQDSRMPIRTLQRAVVLHRCYPKPPTATGLTWSHYRYLLTISDPKARAAFEKLAITRSLSFRELAKLIATRKHTGPTTTPTTTALPRPTEVAYLYRATVHSVIDGDTLILDIDLGFDTYRRERIRLAAIDAPEPHVPAAAKPATTSSPAPCARAPSSSKPARPTPTAATSPTSSSPTAKSTSRPASAKANT